MCIGLDAILFLISSQLETRKNKKKMKTLQLMKSLKEARPFFPYNSVLSVNILQLFSCESGKRKIIMDQNKFVSGDTATDLLLQFKFFNQPSFSLSLSNFDFVGSFSQ